MKNTKNTLGFSVNFAKMLSEMSRGDVARMCTEFELTKYVTSLSLPEVAIFVVLIAQIQDLFASELGFVESADAIIDVLSNKFFIEEIDDAC